MSGQPASLRIDERNRKIVLGGIDTGRLSLPCRTSIRRFEQCANELPGYPSRRVVDKAHRFKAGKEVGDKLLVPGFSAICGLENNSSRTSRTTADRQSVVGIEETYVIQLFRRAGYLCIPRDAPGSRDHD